MFWQALHQLLLMVIYRINHMRSSMLLYICLLPWPPEVRPELQLFTLLYRVHFYPCIFYHLVLRDHTSFCLLSWIWSWHIYKLHLIFLFHKMVHQFLSLADLEEFISQLQDWLRSSESSHWFLCIYYQEQEAPSALH